VRQRRDLLDEVVLGDALRDVCDEYVPADHEASLLLEVARHEVGRTGRDGRAEHEHVTGSEHRQQGVEHGADVRHVDLDVPEARRPERQHDVPRGGRVLEPVREPQAPLVEHPLQQLLGAALLERHHARAHRLQPVRVLVDTDRVEAAVGEAQRERKPDAAEPDHRDVVLEGVAVRSVCHWDS
jgi:hypothetical protein